MRRRIGLLIVALALILALFFPSPVRAQDGLTVLQNSAEAEFPLELHFRLSARSDVDIVDVRLLYKVERESFADVTSEVFLEFEPGTAIELEWTWDMRKTGGMPAGAVVTYWWLLKDASGDRSSTAPAQVDFQDTRYRWQSLIEGNLTLYWYEGGLSAARTIMAAAQQALAQLARDTGAELKRPARIYLYASTRDLLGAMIFPQEWTGGVAFSRFNTIAIGNVPANQAWVQRAIAHELTHLVLEQVTLNPYNEVPIWLNEGLAMFNEGPLETGFLNILKSATASNRLFTIRSLSSPFSAYADSASQAYAQSYSVVEFLVKEYGQEKMLRLLDAFRDGNSYDDALKSVYGFDMDGLDRLWQEYARTRYRGAGVTAAAALPLWERIAWFLGRFLRGTYGIPSSWARGWVG